ncbi:MAG: Acyl-CoA synthetase (AMP-forming)/AMP-acid ligase [Ilumatobacteraceae bacterium]|nr:Acyl-CoA synthetase (AMP-forming)/AMP-acid ligase [Ilumatobacteraceae bacterium]
MRLTDRIDLARGRGLTLGRLMELVAGAHPRRALVSEAGSALDLTTTDAAELVDLWAGGVAARSELGDRVVVATANGYEQFLLTLAVSRAGRLPAPVNAQMAPGEVDHVVADSGAALVIRSTDDVASDEGFGPAVPAEPKDVGALFYTSGTTGKPKGAELTHAGLLGGMSLAALVPTELHRDELVVALPVAHIFGFAIVVGAACAAIPVRFLPRFNPVQVLDEIEQRRATVFAGVPAMYRMLEEAGAVDRDLKSVRLWISGADAMPADLAHRFKRMGASATLPLLGSVGEAIFAEGYGMVETAGGVAVRVSPPLVPASLGGSVGMPLPGVRFKVVDEDGAEVSMGAVGELWLSGPGVLKGYHGAPEASAGALTDDGWLRTGDLARRGPLGIINFEGRMKDVIKRGGYSVYAVEVEQALEDHPDVLEAAVVAVPDERDGEVPVAAVRLSVGSSVEALEALDLPSWVADRLSTYKQPVRYVAVDELPRTGTDKVQRREVVALVTNES